MNRTNRRKAQFKAALAYAAKTAKAWCEENGVTQSHLYAVLAGERESARLVDAIDEYIAAHTPSVAA